MDDLVGSGSIISIKYVLTVCILLMNPSGNNQDLKSIIKLRYPIVDEGLFLTKNGTAKNIHIHPDCGEFGDINPESNIGIIETNEKLEKVPYPTLPKEDDHISEQDGIFMISNFREGNHAATNAQTATWLVITKKVDNSVCAILFLVYDSIKFSPIENLCMSYVHIGDAHSCKSDVGHPLTFRHKGRDILVGLNIHKHGCGHPRSVAAYVCVKNNIKWIRKTAHLEE